METLAVRENRETINTTMGDLIEAITQIALKAAKSQQEGYALASLAIQDILKKNNITKDSVTFE